MSKETIPQSIIVKIKEEYPNLPPRYTYTHTDLREAAIWGYGLSEERIKELEEALEEIMEHPCGEGGDSYNMAKIAKDAINKANPPKGL